MDLTEGQVTKEGWIKVMDKLNDFRQAFWNFAKNDDDLRKECIETMKTIDELVMKFYKECF